MNYLKLIVLLLIICNVPGYLLVNTNPIIGSVLSFSTFFLIIVYYFFNNKEKPIIPFIVLGLLFFFISISISAANSQTFLIIFIKYFIFIIMAASVAHNSNKNEIYALLLLGALSIIFESIFQKGINGRFSGFYLNANPAGFACILGYSLSFSIDNKKIKILGQLLFSIAGFLTFSRTFLLIWVLINLLSLLINYKNVYKIIVGVVLFSLFLSFESKSDLDNRRVNAFLALFDGKVDEDLKKESRTETWANYYDKILNKPIFGNGYRTFSGETFGSEYSTYTIRNGVHNTFLMIIGEAGFFVLLYFLWIYGALLINGIRVFKVDSLVFFASFSLIMYMLTSHNYFDNYLVLFVSLWLYFQMNKMKISYKNNA